MVLRMSFIALGRWCERYMRERGWKGVPVIALGSSRKYTAIEGLGCNLGDNQIVKLVAIREGETIP